MADVYRNGFLNICANPIDIQHRLLQDRRPSSWSPCLDSKSDGQLPMSIPDSAPTHLLGSEIFQLGRIFQECLISPRTVYVDDWDCLFECTKSASLERVPHNWTDISYHGATKQLLCKFAGEDSPYRKAVLSPTFFDWWLVDSKNVMEVWELMIESYSKTYLTFPSDRLEALNAITASFRDLLGDGDIAGHYWFRFFSGSVL